MKKRLRELKKILFRSFKSWLAHKPIKESAVIAYFAIFSIPALLVLVFNFGSLFIEKKKISDEVKRQIEASISPGAAEQLTAAVDKAGDINEGVLSTILGIIIILFGATRVFVQLQDILNDIWQVKKNKQSPMKVLMSNLFSIGLILTIGFLLLLSMVVSTILAAASNYILQYVPEGIVYLFYVLEFFVSLLIVSILFALMFKFLPDVKIRFRNVIPGALLTAFLFLILKYGLSIYFSKAEPASVYGTAGSIVLIMLWAFVSSMVVLFGAEFTRAYADHHKIETEPKENAKKIEEGKNNSDSTFNN